MGHYFLDTQYNNPPSLTFLFSSRYMNNNMMNTIHIVIWIVVLYLHIHCTIVPHCVHTHTRVLYRVSKWMSIGAMTSWLARMKNKSLGLVLQWNVIKKEKNQSEDTIFPPCQPPLLWHIEGRKGIVHFTPPPPCLNFKRDRFCNPIFTGILKRGNFSGISLPTQEILCKVV